MYSLYFSFLPRTLSAGYFLAFSSILEEGLRQVYVVHLCESEDEIEDVGEFVADVFPPHRVCYGTLALGGILETEDLQEFGGLRDHSDGQFLRVVELVPLAFLAEGTDLRFKVGDRRIVVCHTG